MVEKFRDKYGASDVKKYYSKFDVAVRRSDAMSAIMIRKRDILRVVKTNGKVVPLRQAGNGRAPRNQTQPSWPA